MKSNEMYGAMIERGRIEKTEDGWYTVRSLDRDGVVGENVVSGETHDVGDDVCFVLFDDGTGMVIPSGKTDETGEDEPGEDEPGEDEPETDETPMTDIVAEETLIGTFLGKNMYRRVFTHTEIPMGTTQTSKTLPGGLVIDMLVNMYGVYKMGTIAIQVNSYYSSGYYCCARLVRGKMIYTISSNEMTSGYIVMEYTKTE